MEIIVNYIQNVFLFLGLVWAVFLAFKHISNKMLFNLALGFALFCLFFGVGFYLWFSNHNLIFKNNSGAAIQKIECVTPFKTIVYENVEPGKLLNFSFFAPLQGEAKFSIKTDSCQTKTYSIKLSPDLLFDYYHQIQFGLNCRLDVGELYLFDEKIRKK